MENRDKLRVVVIVELAVIIILSSLILMRLSSFNKPVEKIVQYERMTETTEADTEETTRKVVESKKKEETKDNKEVKETKKTKATEKETEEETEIEKEETIKINIEKESNMITTKEGRKWVKVDEYTFFEIGRNEQYIKVSMYEILKEFGTKGKVAGKNGYMYDGKFWYEVAPSEFAEMK